MADLSDPRVGTRGMRGIEDLDVGNRRVFVRVDFNVPLGDGGVVRDDTRIRAALPTLVALRERGAKLVLASHLGRPKGKPDPAFSMEPVAAALAEHLGCPVTVPDEVVGDAAKKLASDLRSGEVILLQNLRFESGERKNDDAFAQALRELADVYVGDAFGVVHRAHASVEALPRLFGERAAGLLMHREIAALQRVLEPERPFVAVVGGAKVSDKLSVLVALVERLGRGDALLIGGAMANTFLAAAGHDLAASLQEPDRKADCIQVVRKAEARDVQLLLPTDLRVAADLDATDATVTPTGDLAPGMRALDIGPQSEARYAAAVARAKTVFWNGPMGLFENPTFSHGTLRVAQAVADCTGYTVVGGGDSVAAVVQSGLADRIDHVSTGGGASMEFVEGRTLPGIAALVV